MRFPQSSSEAAQAGRQPAVVPDLAHVHTLPGAGRQPAIPLAAEPPPSGSAAALIARALDGRAWLRLRLVVDLVALYLASAAALLPASGMRVSASGRWLVLAFPLLVVALLRARQSLDDRLNGSLLDATARVLGTVSLAAMTTVALDSLIGGAHPVALALRLWLFAAVYLGIARILLLALRRHAQSRGVLSIPTLIIGAGLVGEHLVRRLAGEPRYGLRPVGFLDSDPLPQPKGASSHGVPLLGGPQDLADAIARTGARHVILAFSTEPDHVLVEKVRQCEQLGVGVSLVPRLYELINERASLDHVGGLPLLTIRSIDPRGWQFAIKHTLDRSVALVLVLLLAPAMAVIAVAVALSSPGPLLFRQRRVGRDGTEFDLLKFRTMRLAAAEPEGYRPGDGLAPGGIEGIDRRTRVGRLLRDYSLDELPQFINVLAGHMSLVGPRPERPEFVARFISDVSRYEERHRVKSGITGWAQVNGLRGQTSIADRVEWDNFYIQNWTLSLDLRIMALTALEVLRHRKDL
jgi:exopolysaccharide biosynthesis polyprenyl glycosylphosphotransferase